MIKRLFMLVLGFGALVATAAPPAVQSFHPRQVTLLPGPLKDAETVALRYVLSLDVDRLLAPYRREAGLPAKAESYTNWENTGLDGHIGGHYLTSLSLMYAATGNEEVLRRLRYMLDELALCQQQGKGYIGGVPGSKELWEEIRAGKIDAGAFSLNKRWVPLYNIHKPYAGLRDAWLIAGQAKARDMLIGYAGWMLELTAALSERQIQDMLRSEHGGLNEVFADVAHITGDARYLQMARRFSHQRILQPLSRGEDQLNGMHANTQIPKVIGFERIAALTGDTAMHRAARYFWENVVHHRSCAIGGNSVREHFHPIDDYSSMMTSEQGPETCNTYNMMKLSRFLFESEGDERYVGYYERALYNHILSTQHPEKGGFVYFTPMRPGHYRVYSQPSTSMWCCVGSGLENHAKYNELIYARRGDALLVNLFIPSELRWEEKGLKVRQLTAFPEEEVTTLELQLAKSRTMTVALRYPSWVAAALPVVKVNGKPAKYRWSGEAKSDCMHQAHGRYLEIDRRWRNGDRITLELPMKTTLERLPDGSDYVAVMHGPIVLAAPTGTGDLTGLFADDSRGGHIAAGRMIPLSEVPSFVSNHPEPATLIKPVSGKALRFTADELVFSPDGSKPELRPFYQLHDARYVVYWPLMTPARRDEVLARQQEEARRMREEAEATLDHLVCGEQQPESDHFIAFENSEIGVHMNRHWRHAAGWFSYRLRDPQLRARVVRLTLFGGDRNRNFRVLINGQPVREIALDGSRGNEFYTLDVPVPAQLRDASGGTLTVRFEAQPGSLAGGIYEVRLMK